MNKLRQECVRFELRMRRLPFFFAAHSCSLFSQNDDMKHISKGYFLHLQMSPVGATSAEIKLLASHEWSMDACNLFVC